VDVALAPLTVGRPSPGRLVTAAATAGFRRVGLTLWVPDGTESPGCVSSPCTSAADRRTLRSHLDASGVSVLDVGVVVLSPSLDLDRVAGLVETASALGSDRLVVMNRDDVPGRAAANLHAVCSLAAPAGMRVGIEFMPYTATRTLREATALVTAAAAPNAGLIVDLLHLYRSGGTADDLAGLPPEAVHLVQLCDARRQAPPAADLRAEALADRLYPGEGKLPLRTVLAALPRNVCTTVEAPVARHADRSPAYRAMAAAVALHRLMADGPGGR
jgi:sugar phosphate isomerase/epimerase